MPKDSSMERWPEEYFHIILHIQQSKDSLFLDMPKESAIKTRRKLYRFFHFLRERSNKGDEPSKELELTTRQIELVVHEQGLEIRRDSAHEDLQKALGTWQETPKLMRKTQLIDLSNFDDLIDRD